VLPDDSTTLSKLIRIANCEQLFPHDGTLPDDTKTLSKLVRVAGCKRLPRHVGELPDDGKTLSKLVSLTDDRFQELIEDGT